MKRDYQMTEQLKGLLRTIFVRLSKGSSFSKTGITEKKLSETPRISFTKLYLLKVSFLGLSLFLSTFLAAQCPADLNVSNGNTGTWTNTTGGDATVRITAVGGGGGKNTAVNFPGQGQVGTLFGGSGATMIGTFVVPPGVTLFAISGQAGVSTVNAGSGGGGSGVVSCGNPQNCANGTILILAGGGGGSSGFLNGQGGQITQGSGNGGNSLSGAAGGGGLNSAGQIGVPTQGVTVIAYGGGQVSKVAISNGGTAGTRYGITGAAGGNGMGGGGATGGDLYASGGGGYSGGNGEHDDYIQGAGGGGSFNSGTSQTNTPGTAGGGANPGSVLIECLSFVPNCTTPTAYSVTGGGSYCSGGPGVAIGLSNSETGVNYQLKIGGVNTGGTFPGTNGTAISFGNQTVAGNYTVEATTATGGCTNTMTGSVNVSITPDVGTPSFTSGATSLCAGGTSTYAATASDASSIVYSILNGTGASIDANSGVVSNVTGNYTVVATASGTCGPNTTANRVVT
ncbi:MAG: hypothetical protein K1X92_14270, partial [Bacteroidia bacterium]|nr:hypothetical protein [Bacteroidia bacterium]